ncbi:MAG: hypothetical protein AAFQ67_05610 [Pseudomonadota bacterium]
MPYRRLDPEKIIDTLERLDRRINERFPKRGLHKVSAELLAIARDDAERCAWAERPNWWLRCGVTLVIIAIAIGLCWLFWSYRTATMDQDSLNGFEGVEALFNILILSAGGVWFVANQENRYKRERILKDLHELRSIAHVIDMHQLTKDPTAILDNSRATKSSYKHDMTEFELIRYFDYCAELLSLTGKLAALYMRGTRDSVVIQAVNEIEDLSSGLVRKIWQKIMITRQTAERTKDKLKAPQDPNETASEFHPFALDPKTN